jgi:hypothetical protein
MGMAPSGDELVTLTTARTELEGSLLRAVLADADIPAFVFATAAATVQWEGGYTDPIKVQVRAKDVERARAALAKNRQDSVDLDWNEVDVGEMESMSEEARPRFSMERYTARRGRRRRMAKVGFALMLGSMMLAALGAQAVVPAAIVTGMLVSSAWTAK